MCVKQEPNEEDRLTPAEFEDLVEEVLKSYRTGDITKDPYMSPLLATDEMLSGLPPVHIVVGILFNPRELTISVLVCTYVRVQLWIPF